jgi:hypothetical protein
MILYKCTDRLVGGEKLRGLTMADLSTRPSQGCRQTRNLFCLSLAALFVSAAPALSAKQLKLNAASATASAFAHDLSISDAEPGEEVLRLSARLAETIDEPVQDMHWTVRDENGDIVQDQTATLAKLKLPPGTYRVDAHYGETVRTEVIQLPEGKQVSFGFVLNAGALRVLPRIANIPTSAAAKSTVYALSGIEKGKLIASSRVAGRIFSLPAGTYRVKTEYENGNVAAVTDVRVKAGVMSAVDIDHKAGVARLAYPGSDEVIWNVKSASGEALLPMGGTSVSLILKPGQYLAEASVGMITTSAKFKIENGEQREITLGE